MPVEVGIKRRRADAAYDELRPEVRHILEEFEKSVRAHEAASGPPSSAAEASAFDISFLSMCC